MMNRPVILSAILFAATAISPLTQATAGPPVCTASSADASAIIETVRAWYDSEIPGDIDQWHAQVTPDFYVFDEGTRSTGDEMFHDVHSMIQSFLRQDPTITRKLSLDDQRIEVDCNTALATFTLHVSIDAPQLDKHTESAWLESYWLKKQDGRWRIAFYHTTRMPQVHAPTSEKK